MALTEEERIAQAVSEGYPDIDQVCPADGCGVVFKNYTTSSGVTAAHVHSRQVRHCLSTGPKSKTLKALQLKLEVSNLELRNQ
jgi:hypothetical protein